MRVYKNKPFARFERRNGISIAALCQAVTAVESGRADADLGSGLFKQRVARGGAGKSGGYRVLLVLKSGETAFLVHGFAKSELENVGARELKALKQLARELLALSPESLAKAVAADVWIEVKCDGQESR